mgnify:CR=1 FL=1
MHDGSVLWEKAIEDSWILRGKLLEQKIFLYAFSYDKDRTNEKWIGNKILVQRITMPSHRECAVKNEHNSKSEEDDTVKTIVIENSAAPPLWDAISVGDSLDTLLSVLPVAPLEMEYDIDLLIFDI